MAKVDPWVVVALAAGAGAAALVWCQYHNDPHDTDWTDPQQPPAMVAAPVADVGCRPTRPYSRSYPDSLAAWDGTVVGDC